MPQSLAKSKFQQRKVQGLLSKVQHANAWTRLRTDTHSNPVCGSVRQNLPCSHSTEAEYRTSHAIGSKGSRKQGPVTGTTAREAHKRAAERTAAEQLVVETASKQQSVKVEKSTEEAQKPVEGQNADRNCSPDECEPSSNSSAVSLCTS